LADEPALKPVPADAPPPAFVKDIQPLLKKYCLECHSGDQAKAGLTFESFKDERTALGRRQVWEKVSDQLEAAAMPPEEKPQPTDDERALLLRWIEARVLKIDCSHPDPGRVTIRRLNRTEYNNTIRDLLGVDFKPAEDFPSDDVGYGFDNIGDVLSLSPLLLEKYLAAADKIVSTALRNPESRRKIVIYLPTEDVKEESARRILENFARRAFRRPVSGEEIGRLLKLVQLAESHGDDFYDGLQVAMKAVLVSPHFLYRIELDSEPNNPKAVHPVT